MSPGGDDGADTGELRHTGPKAPPSVADGWSRIGRVAGYVAGGAFLAQTVLYLLDVTGALIPQTIFRRTDRGLQHDLADYYVAYHERMHSIWWNVALRDVLGPLGYLALIVLIVALLHLVATGKPREQLGQLFVLLGAWTAALSDLTYLSHITWWRAGGFQATPDIVAHGRAFEVLDNMGSYLQFACCLILALGITCLAPTFREAPLESRRLSFLAYCQAASLVAFVVTQAADADWAGNMAALISGLFIAPTLAILTGHALGSDFQDRPPGTFR